MVEEEEGIVLEVLVVVVVVVVVGSSSLVVSDAILLRVSCLREDRKLFFSSFGSRKILKTETSYWLLVKLPHIGC